MVAEAELEKLGWKTFGFEYVYDGKSIATPAFELAPLGTSGLDGYNKLWAIDMTINDFRLREVIRAVKIRQIGGTTPPADHLQPAPNGQVKPTRLDLDVHDLHPNGEPQATEINVHLARGLKFWPKTKLPAITAKTADSATRLVNLTYVDNEIESRHVRFWSLSTAGNAGATVVDEFNIAVIATDGSQPTAFALPVIIDPVIRNRNG